MRSEKNKTLLKFIILQKGVLSSCLQRQGVNVNQYHANIRIMHFKCLEYGKFNPSQIITGGNFFCFTDEQYDSYNLEAGLASKGNF